MSNTNLPNRRYLVINAATGHAIGMFVNSISARTTLEIYLRNQFEDQGSKEPVHMYIYSWTLGETAFSTNKRTFTSDNYRLMLSISMI
jgi:hypothetical protein